MSKRKPMDKAQARERRNRLLESAAAAELSLTEGVREMRAISGMTQEEFARHREVSARVIKAIELGRGNPTVATLNRIGEFFGLEVGFVPIRQKLTKEHQELIAAANELAAVAGVPPTGHGKVHPHGSEEQGLFHSASDIARQIEKAQEEIRREIQEAFRRMDKLLGLPGPEKQSPPKGDEITDKHAETGKKPG